MLAAAANKAASIASKTLAEAQSARSKRSLTIEEVEALANVNSMCGATSACPATSGAPHVHIPVPSAAERKEEKQKLNMVLDLHFDRQGTRRASSLSVGGDGLDKSNAGCDLSWDNVPSLLV
jgi:hypothetical protein